MDTKEEMLALLEETAPADKHPTVFLATWDGTGSRVRPVTLVRDGLYFYFGTGRKDNKTRQIAGWPQVEFVVLLKHEFIGYLRVSGKAVEMTGPEKREAWERGKGYDVEKYWEGGLDDPRFIMFSIVPDSMRLVVPGEMNEQELPPEWFKP